MPMTRCPSRTVKPAAWASSARALVTAAKSTIAVTGECSDELSALVVGQSALLAELLEQADPPTAEAGLERPGRVVDAGMDDPAVVAGLVDSEARLLLKQRQVGIGQQLEEATRQGDAEDPTAHHADPKPHVLPS
jgi:hypothetical protein